MRRDNGECQIKGPRCLGNATEADHRIPWAEGGTDSIENGQAACDPCHKEKTHTERLRGMKKRSRKREPMSHPGLA